MSVPRFEPRRLLILSNSTLARPEASPVKKAVKRIKSLFRKPAEERYLDALTRKLAAGAPHSTLGANIRDV